jgi:hypothetical protein
VVNHVCDGHVLLAQVSVDIRAKEAGVLVEQYAAVDETVSVCMCVHTARCQVALSSSSLGQMCHALTCQHARM